MGVLRAASFAAVLALSAAAPALAHVSVTPKTAEAGGYQVLRFGLGHGCEGKATTALRVEIPEGVASARPQPKPGWTLKIDPAASSGGRVQAITWTGELPADQFDEFLIQVKLPATAGPVAFPAVQTCGSTVLRWDQPTPAAGPRPQRPAPVVTLTPGAEAGPARGDHRH